MPESIRPPLSPRVLRISPRIVTIDRGHSVPTGGIGARIGPAAPVGAFIAKVPKA